MKPDTPNNWLLEGKLYLRELLSIAQVPCYRIRKTIAVTKKCHVNTHQLNLCPLLREFMYNGISDWKVCVKNSDTVDNSIIQVWKKCDSPCNFSKAEATQWSNNRSRLSFIHQQQPSPKQPPVLYWKVQYHAQTRHNTSITQPTAGNHGFSLIQTWPPPRLRPCSDKPRHSVFAPPISTKYWCIVASSVRRVYISFLLWKCERTSHLNTVHCIFFIYRKMYNIWKTSIDWKAISQQKKICRHWK